MIAPDSKGRLGFHNFRDSLATALVKLKVDLKTVQGVLRHKAFGTTMELYAQSHMESMRARQVSETADGGQNPSAHGASSVRIIDGSWVENFGPRPLSSFESLARDGVEPPTPAFSDCVNQY